MTEAINEQFLEQATSAMTLLDAVVVSLRNRVTASRDRGYATPLDLAAIQKANECLIDARSRLSVTFSELIGTDGEVGHAP